MHGAPHRSLKILSILAASLPAAQIAHLTRSGKTARGGPPIIGPILAGRIIKCKAAEHDMRAGKIPLAERGRLALVRNVGLHSDGSMNKSALQVASKLDIPRHLGAGGSDDFVSDEVYKKRVKRAKLRKK